MEIYEKCHHGKVRIQTLSGELKNMICKICGVNETDNPDGICDDCKFSIISNDDIPPNF